MANNRIKGITVEINGDTTKLTKALEGANRSINNTQKALRDVERLLKLDPGNTDLLRQKQELLTKAVDSTTEKLSKLRAAQAQMDAEGVERTSEEYQGLQREIVETEQQLKKLESAAKSSNTAMSKVSTVAGEISEKTGALAEKTKGLSQAAGGVLMGIGVVAGKAVNAYADCEQLVGGIETLFSDSADTVREYAEGAYKTAGMSANEYMRTTTAFSASLLQSLGGDTAKAAKVADMAITDMSDNANKMGSDIASIELAYQGFAKQQYGLLDNLKLGYGGSKKEMERLLKDAEKLSGVKYDISSLSDVYEAIHVIQSELGITGTTAKEASETIAGAGATLKSSIDNWLAGIGQADADVEELTKAVTDSAKTLADNILAVLKQIWENIPTSAKISIIMLGIVASISPLLSIISSVSGGISAITGAMSTLGVAVGPVLGVVAAVVALGAAFKHLWDTNEEFRAAITEIWQNIEQTLSGFFQGIVDRLNEFGFEFTDITDVLKAAWNGLCQILAPVFEGAFKYVEVILSTATGVLTGYLDYFIGIFTGDWNRAWEGVKTVFSSVWSGISGFFSNIINTLRSIADVFLGWFGTSWSSVWVNIKAKTSNAWNGILTAIKTPIEKARDTVKNAIDKIKSFFNFQFSWPKLKLPHFGISPAGWKIGDLLQGSIPKLSISWYAKAMNSPMLLNSPTIFGMAGGNLLGAGEAGAEVVSGAATLMRMIESAMSNVLMLSSPIAASNSTVRHTGTIRIEGVNNRGEFFAAANAVLADMGIGSLTKIIMEEIQAETERREAVY